MQSWREIYNRLLKCFSSDSENFYCVHVYRFPPATPSSCGDRQQNAGIFVLLFLSQ